MMLLEWWIVAFIAIGCFLAGYGMGCAMAEDDER
jgi:hypothetical protein